MCVIEKDALLLCQKNLEIPSIPLLPGNGLAGSKGDCKIGCFWCGWTAEERWAALGLAGHSRQELADAIGEARAAPKQPQNEAIKCVGRTRGTPASRALAAVCTMHGEIRRRWSRESNHILCFPV